jgi:hypothetical protein
LTNTYEDYRLTSSVNHVQRCSYLLINSVKLG